MQGKLDEAEPLYKEALAIDKKVFGDEHPNVAGDLNNLAELLRTQGKYDDAKPLQEEALAIRKKVLGEEHPEVAESLNNLALLLDAQVRPFLKMYAVSFSCCGAHFRVVEPRCVC